MAENPNPLEYTRDWTDPGDFPSISYTKNWNIASDFPTIETDETQVRADMQYLYDEIKDYINGTLGTYLGNYKELCIEAADWAEAYAKGTVDGEPVAEGEPGYHDNAYYYRGLALADASIAEQWATGGTGGTPSAENNAEYYSEQSEAWATGGTGGTPGAENNAEYYSGQSEAWATGGTGGTPGGENNAKHFSAQAEAWATGGTGGTPSAENNAAYYAGLAEQWATGETGGEPGESNNAAYYAGQAAGSATAAEALVGNVYKAFPTESDSGGAAYTAVGADGVPVKAIAVSDIGDYAVAPDVFIQTAAPHAVSSQTTLSASPRCIIFPCVGLTPCTVTVSASATLRIASFADYPTVGSTPSNYAAASGTTVSITPLSGDKWILAQLLADADGKTLADVTGAGFGVSPTPVWLADAVRRTGKNLAPAATLTGYWDSPGNLKNGGTHTPCFPVVAGEKYAWSIQTANASHTYLVWYDATFTQIAVAAGQRRLNANTTSVVLTAPDGATWASLSFYAAQGALQFELGTAATPIAAYNGASAMLDLTDGTLTPALTTVRGINTVWADNGSVAVEFRCDPNLYIAQAIAAAVGS